MLHRATSSYVRQQPATLFVTFEVRLLIRFGTSSNLWLTRICEYCGESFTARTTVTKFCGHLCASRAYKKRARTQAASKSDEETVSKLSLQLRALQAQSYLTVQDACTLLGVSRWTICRASESGQLRIARIGRRIVIRREDIEKLFAA